MNLAAIILVLAIVAADQFTKFFVNSAVMPHESIPVINGVFHITLVHNTGMAFGLFKGRVSILIIFAIITMLAIVALSMKSRTGFTLAKLGLYLMFAG
ncbi:MAG: signal peptidase II, partial [Candidatus Omnitrophica bacterium]|nr:signal peptidase II [Candidatus Omnitrophota bacterium]